MPIRVLIADDDPLIREGLAILLAKDPEISVAALAADGREAVEYCGERQIDIALIDIRMPIMDGVNAAARIAALSPVTKTIILTTFQEDELIRQAVANGAKGYLLKGKSAEEIREAIKLVHAGSTVFQDTVFERLRNAQPQGIDPELFTEREREIMELIAEGLSNKDIASRLFLSEGTVKNYISALLDKLGLKQRTQIAAYYYKKQTKR